MLPHFLTLYPSLIPTGIQSTLWFSILKHGMTQSGLLDTHTAAATLIIVFEKEKKLAR